MMTLANYGIGSSKHKDPNSAKVLSKSLQIRNRAEMLFKQHLKSNHRVSKEKRVEILNSIKEYYSRIPFDVVIWNKYQTKQCIIDSILLLDTKFNPYKARAAFMMVENMLMNLVFLPWHKEFRKIYTYSGEFRLSVSDPLIGIEEVFKAAGFQYSIEFPMHLVLPEDKMPQTDDGESVTSVIFDCMVAQVVCSNIIEVYENCCRAAKQSEEICEDVNYCSWIHSYFKQRSQHTTDISCSNIQDLLLEVTNHVSRLNFSAIKVPKQINRVANQSGDRDNGSISKSNTNINDTVDSSKFTAQERTRGFLARQSLEEDNLLTLSSDLLRLPSIDDSNKRLVHPVGRSIVSDSGLQRQEIRPNLGDPIQRQQPLSILNGGNSIHHHRQALHDRALPKHIEYLNSNYHSNANIYRGSSDSLGHQIEVDVPQNDREPLLPRFDRRLITNHSQSQAKRNSLYENDFENGFLGKSNGHSSSSRRRFEEPYFNETSSHPQTTPTPLNQGLASSKYNSSAHRKYESRDTENTLTNSRSYWSCGSCTYNNQVSSEICEMCRNRRSCQEHEMNISDTEKMNNSIFWKIFVIVTTILVICFGIYLSFWSLSVLKSPFIYRRFLGVGTVMIAFGCIVLIMMLVPQNLCEIDRSSVFECGSIMTFSASLVPLTIALITFLLPLEKDLKSELNLPTTRSQVRTMHNFFINLYLKNSPQKCDLKCDIMEKSGLLQMVTIIISLLNGISLNLLSLIREFGTLKKVHS